MTRWVLLLSWIVTSSNSWAQSVPIPDTLPPGVVPAMIAEGREIFGGRGLCYNCHGPLAGGLLGPDLTDADWWQAPGDYLAIVNRVLMGVPAEESISGREMPSRGGAPLSDAEVHAVAAYVWRISHPTVTDSVPAGVTEIMIQRGREVFETSGCAGCHGDDARGNIGPNLTDNEWLHAKGSFLTIVSTVLSGVPAERSHLGTTMPPRGGANLTVREVHAVASYVWALSRAGR